MAPRKYFGKGAEAMDAPVSETPVEAKPVATSADKVRACSKLLTDAIELAIADGYSVSMNFTLADLGRIVISETGKVKK